MRIGLPRPKRGDAVMADHIVQLSDAVESLLTVRTGRGLSARFGLDGLMLALTGRQAERIFWVKITAVHGPAGWNGTDVLFPSEITYDVVSLDRGWTAEGMTPVYGRQVEDDECKVHAQRPGTLALVLRNPQDSGEPVAELMLFRENVARGPC